MKILELNDNWPRTIAIIVLTAILFWGYGCPSRTTSLTNSGKMITRPELQIELDAIIATAEFKLAELDKQDKIRDIIFKNATIMVTSGTLNPVGLMTMFAGIYGISRGGSDIVKRAKKRKENTT